MKKIILVVLLLNLTACATGYNSYSVGRDYGRGIANLIYSR